MNVVITGAGKGIGFELLRKFIAESSNSDTLIAISRNLSQLNNLEIKAKNLITIECDITNGAQLNQAIEKIFNNCNHIDYLVNNAGKLVNKPFTEINTHDINQVFDTNFKAPFIIIQRLFKLLIKSNSAHVVNISSMGGFQGASKFAGLSAYSSSKAAIACLSQCLAEEFKNTNIKVNALCIGAVETEMLSQAFPNYKAPISASEMANYIFNFVCNNHKCMNGQVIPVALSVP